VHVFKYSNRKGTASSKLPEQIDGAEKNRRSSALIDAGDISSTRFFEKNSGQKNCVLIEEYVAGIGCYTGYTDNYIKAYIKKNQSNLDNDINEFVNVRLTEVFKDGMLAELIT
jgi:threonylcarbamoyladenosine tRNA methylthiotransferase MtaB